DVFLQDTIHLQPLHPDHCGGLSPIGSYLTTTVYAILPVGLMIAVDIIIEIRQQTIASAYPIYVMVGAYVLGTLVIFFAPLLAAHRAMVQAKRSELARLSESFNRLYQQLGPAFQERDRQVLNGASEEIEALTRLHT